MGRPAIHSNSALLFDPVIEETAVVEIAAIWPFFRIPLGR